ncbi:MAG TPA: ester cyclase [Steroidobacteraceae bacterium]|jgi:predicted SnoaL-like aldol condensation-catalyzing enzyme|nr:ester cyclase [Steroidobacteraceae bacterium]
MVLRNRMIGCTAAACLFLATTPAAFADEALTARNKALVTDFYATVLIGRNVDAAARFLSPGYIQHSGDMPSGRKAFMDLFRANFAKKPPSDYKREILRVVGDNDIVVIFNRQSGTDDQGKHHLVLQFDMFRVENAVIVEHWDAD